MAIQDLLKCYIVVTEKKEKKKNSHLDVHCTSEALVIGKLVGVLDKTASKFYVRRAECHVVIGVKKKNTGY